MRQDLALLGSQAPAGPDVDGVGGEARQFGILYVLEGSRLGGKILARQAEAHSDPLIRTATHYLRHGENESFWPSFLGALESSPAVRRAPDEAICGARFAFGRFAGAGP